MAGSRNKGNLPSGTPSPYSPHKTLIMVKSKLLLRCGIFPKSKHTHHNQSQAQFKQHGPHIPTVGGRPRRGQAGDTTLAAPPDQIYQHFYKTANTNLWCLGFLSSAWSLRLTVDIPGFVAGTATQTLLQRSFLRGGEREKKNFDVSCKFSSLCFSSKCLCTQKPAFPPLCLQPSANG